MMLSTRTTPAVGLRRHASTVAIAPPKLQRLRPARLSEKDRQEGIEDNVRRIREKVDRAHESGNVTPAELGHGPGKEGSDDLQVGMSKKGTYEGEATEQALEEQTQRAIQDAKERSEQVSGETKSADTVQGEASESRTQKGGPGQWAQQAKDALGNIGSAAQQSLNPHREENKNE